MFFQRGSEKPKQHSWDPTGFRCFFLGLYTLISKSSFWGELASSLKSCHFILKLVPPTTWFSILQRFYRKLVRSLRKHISTSEFRFVKYRLHCDLISDIVSVSIIYPENLPTKDHEKISFQSLSSNKKQKSPPRVNLTSLKHPPACWPPNPMSKFSGVHFPRRNPVYIPLPNDSAKGGDGERSKQFKSDPGLRACACL